MAKAPAAGKAAKKFKDTGGAPPVPVDVAASAEAAAGAVGAESKAGSDPVGDVAAIGTDAVGEAGKGDGAAAGTALESGHQTGDRMFPLDTPVWIGVDAAAPGGDEHVERGVDEAVAREQQPERHAGDDRHRQAVGREAEADAGEEQECLVVVGPARGRRRCGVRFGPEPEVIPLAWLRPDEVEAIEADPELTVVRELRVVRPR